MKKQWKAAGKWAMALALAAVLVFCGARYGWRLYGFDLCSEDVFLTEVTREGTALSVRGGVANSLTAYVGHVYKIQGDTLILGVKENAFLGFFRRNGGFHFEIDTKGTQIHTIILKSGNAESIAWTEK